MKKVFFSWLGANEIFNVLNGYDSQIAKAHKDVDFTKIVLFGNLAPFVYKKMSPHTKDAYEMYKKRIEQLCGCKVELHQIQLSKPTDLAGIHAAVDGIVGECEGKYELFYNASGGTNAMTIIWVFQRNYWGGKLIETSFPGLDNKTAEFEIPFEIQTNFIKKIDTALQKEETVKEFAEIKGTSRQIKAAKKLCLRMSQHDSLHLLLLGETGTGKEAFARAIHAASLRKGGKFIAVNCGAIPENLIESTLFGYEKGAFTGATEQKKGVFEEAEGGTVFLDEIGDLPPQTQVKLLRAIPSENIKATITRLGGIKEVEVKARIIAATHKDLREKISKGQFREDLYFRLAVIEVNVPPLRERENDIEYLLDFFFNKYKKEAGMMSKHINKEAKALLLKHTWPGNVRELINTVRRLVYIVESNDIKPENIKGLLYEPYSKTDKDGGNCTKSILERPLSEMKAARRELETSYVRRALDRANGNITAAGRLLGIKSHAAMRKAMTRLEIKFPA
ncbi:MAG: sigma-54 dependent transcriptional regulator [uncultured bacterium]|nr:MAG: sigma-54 dependent transcriptional regulator [uncultured bacterium]